MDPCCSLARRHGQSRSQEPGSQAGLGLARLEAWESVAAVWGPALVPDGRLQRRPQDALSVCGAPIQLVNFLRLVVRPRFCHLCSNTSAFASVAPSDRRLDR